MTLEADRQRSIRQHAAAPGGGHDRLVRFLAVALPAAVGIITAFMVLAPLSPRSEVSFLLDKTKVEMIGERLRVNDAMYRGKDNRGRPFSITAGSALQKTQRVPEVEMRDLVARILLADGPAMLNASAADYLMDRQRVEVSGPVTFNSADGYRMTARDMDIDIGGRRLVSRGRVEGRIPAGTFSADRIVADLAARTIMLDGNARLRMEPGKLQMP